MQAGYATPSFCGAVAGALRVAQSQFGPHAVTSAAETDVMPVLTLMQRLCAKLTKSPSTKQFGAPLRDPRKKKTESDGYVSRRRPALRRDPAPLRRYPAYEPATGEPLLERMNTAAFRRELDLLRIGLFDASYQDCGSREPMPRRPRDADALAGRLQSFEPAPNDEISGRLQDALTSAVKRLGGSGGAPRP
jgi:hypothetical protein